MKILSFPVLLFGMMISCQARADNPANTVEVRAVGSVTVPSDTVVLRLSISTSHADLQEAKKRNDQIATPIYQLAESQHVSRPTLLTTGLSFHFVPSQPRANKFPQLNANQDPFDAGADQEEDGKPQYNQNVQGGKKGFRHAPAESTEPPIHLSRDLEVSFHDVNQAIKFIAEMTKWDSVRTTCELRLAPLSFGVVSRDKHLMEAQRLAVASAREKAQLLADQNGLKLGRATLIYDDYAGAADDPFGPAPLLTEPRGYSPALRPMATQQEHPAKLEIDQIPPAQVTITASVRIVFEVNNH